MGPVEVDGRVRVEMRFELETDACAFALSFGPRVEVLEPTDVRRDVARLSAAAAALYR